MPGEFPGYDPTKPVSPPPVEPVDISNASEKIEVATAEVQQPHASLKPFEEQFALYRGKLELFRQSQADLDEQLRNLQQEPDRDVKRQRLAELIANKKAIQTQINEYRLQNPTLASHEAALLEQERFQELLTKLPDQDDARRFVDLYNRMSPIFNGRFLRSLKAAANQADPVKQTTALRGVIFEMSRYQLLLDQQLETVATSPLEGTKVSYLGYDRPKEGQDPLQIVANGAVKPLSSKIDFDVPMIRENGQAYVYEAKAYPRMQYGSKVEHYNQLLKYNQAIAENKVAGATVELQGRIDERLLKWASGSKLDEEGAIPFVELVYSYPLPSGAEYRFVIKRGAKNNGLQFQNEGRQPQLDQTLNRLKVSEPERYAKLLREHGDDSAVLAVLQKDQHIINGLQRAVVNRSIIDILAHTELHTDDPELAPFINKPDQITDLGIFRKYEATWRNAIESRLLALRESTLINTENKRSAASETGTPEEIAKDIEQSLRQYQAYLAQNPEMAKVKKGYIVAEENIPVVVQEAVNRVLKIRSYEQARGVDAHELGRQQQRMQLGYTGQPEGVALDHEHVLIDAIQDVNKNRKEAQPNGKKNKEAVPSRSYDQPERFLSVQQLQNRLASPELSRRYLALTIYDPLNQSSQLIEFKGETGIPREEARIRSENLERAKKALARIQERFEELSAQASFGGLSPEEKTELERVILPRKRAHDTQQRGLNQIEQHITALQTQKEQAVKSASVDQKRQLASDWDRTIDEQRELLTQRYKEILGGEPSWQRLARRVTDRVDQNLIKFIYTVDSEGTFRFDEEVIRGDVSGRAAHSELAQGRNIYGAGELAFTKTDSGWQLSEINNGSGHYRPDATQTLHYVQNELTQQGINTSQVVLRDTLRRGLPIREMTLLEE